MLKICRTNDLHKLLVNWLIAIGMLCLLENYLEKSNISYIMHIA